MRHGFHFEQLHGVVLMLCSCIFIAASSTCCRARVCPPCLLVLGKAEVQQRLSQARAALLCLRFGGDVSTHRGLDEARQLTAVVLLDPQKSVGQPRHLPGLASLLSLPPVPRRLAGPTARLVSPWAT